MQAKCDEQQIGIDRDTEGISVLEKQIEQLEGEISEGEAASKKRNDLIEQRLRDIATTNQKISDMASRGSEPLEGNSSVLLPFDIANMLPTMPYCMPIHQKEAVPSADLGS